MVYGQKVFLLRLLFYPLFCLNLDLRLIHGSIPHGWTLDRIPGIYRASTNYHAVGYNCYSTDSHPRYTDAMQSLTPVKLYGYSRAVKFHADYLGVNFPVYTNTLQSLTTAKFYGYSRAVKFYARPSGLYNSPRW